MLLPKIKMRLSVLFAVVVLAVFAGLTDGQKRNYSTLPCPDQCVCFRRTIRCMQLNLEEVPKVSSQTTLLDLRFNKIRKIEPGTFKGLKNIRSLLLSNNLLTTLKDGVFAGLPQLKHLYLYKNRIRSIEAHAFQNLPRLEHLYLYNNDLEEFKVGTFSNLPSLDRLFLYENKIKHIPHGAFENLPQLTRLRLDSNALVCDCRIAWLANMINEQSMLAAAICKYPNEMYGKPLKGMTSSDFHCKAPAIMEEPDDLEISFGGTAVFKCHAEGEPSPKITWMKDDNEIRIAKDDERFEIDEDGSLKIKHIVESDSGFYECMAKNNDGVIKSRQARMVVFRPESRTAEESNGKPQFILTPQSVTAREDTYEVKLDCKAAGVPKPEISWSKNGIALDIRNRYYQDEEGSLTIKPLSSSDYGIYRCDAANYLGRVSATAEIIINSLPIFTVVPKSQKVDAGTTVRFECDASGSPQPEIAWYLGSTRLQNGVKHIIRENGRLLEIPNAREADSNVYTCRVKNELGKRTVDVNLSVKETQFRAPTLLYKPYNVEALVGATIEIPCKGEGKPTPSTQWLKDGEPLQRTGRWRESISGNLYIYNIALEDQGRYECSAFNEYGRATASGYISVKEDSHTKLNIGNIGGNVGDKFVKIAFVEASQEVDKAINKTLQDIFANKNHNVGDLFRIIRYPNAPARELARAAEVYERTLVNIRKHVQKGMKMNNTVDFNYKEILSTDHLDLVAQLSGCMVHRQKKNCTDMCFHSKYRSIDGTCNNLQNPMWGASLTGFRRVLKPIYENGFSTPVGWDKTVKYFGYSKPSSRLVSTKLIATRDITPDDRITHMVMQWGQFLDHDLDHAIPAVSSESWNGIDCKRSCDYSAPCFPIDVPPNDPRVKNRRCIDFFRSSAICGSGITSVFFDHMQPREQINQLTAYIDASQVYGFSEELSRELRELTNDLGKLKEGVVLPGRKPLLPYSGGQMDCRRDLSESSVNCFLAGDIRANEQTGLISMHTLWFREHNRLAKELRTLNPHWEGDMIYHEARKIVGGAMQHITYTQWLPLILGHEGMKLLGPYDGYNPRINPSISNVFATAALRFGHSLINPILHRLNASFEPIKEGHLHLHKAFFSPWRILDEGGIDPILRGLYSVPAKLKKPTQNLNTDLTERLFETAHAVALDLAAINIHRSRDHAIPGYVEFRKVCGMSPVETFDDLSNEITDYDVREKLRELYGHPGNIDVWVGGILEDQVAGGKVGPLFRCLLIEQFKRLRSGDRFWYENPSTFKPEQLVQIKQYSLASVLCDNGDNISDVTENVFVLPNAQGGYEKCENIHKVDLSFWSECCTDCRYSGQLNTISRLNARNRRHTGATEHATDDITSQSDFNNRTLTENRTVPRPDEKQRMQTRITTLEDKVAQLQVTIRKLNKIIKNLSSSRSAEVDDTME